MGTDDIVTEIIDHGYCIVPDAFSEEFCDEVLDEIHRLETTRVPRSLDNNFHGHKTLRFFDVLNHGEVWQRLATHEALLPVVKGVLGDDCLLNTYGTSIIGPGETAQVIHCDDFPFTDANNSALRERPRLDEGGPRRPIVLNTMVALSDFTEETGATRIVPDSNKLAYPAKKDSDSWSVKSVPALMPKGGLMFFEGQCFHGGGANTTTGERRYGVTIDFCAGYLRTQENFILSIGEERAATFSSALQELIGFRISDGGLGHVYNHNPSPLMKKIHMPFTELD